MYASLSCLLQILNVGYAQKGATLHFLLLSMLKLDQNQEK